eukprot:1601236-Amphidinium_carterae.1
MLMIRLEGFATPDDLCSDALRTFLDIVHQNVPPDGVLPPSWTAPQKRAWGDAISPGEATDAMLEEAFLSHDWTTIQIVRDP